MTQSLHAGTSVFVLGAVLLGAVGCDPPPCWRGPQQMVVTPALDGIDLSEVNPNDQVTLWIEIDGHEDKEDLDAWGTGSIELVRDGPLWVPADDVLIIPLEASNGDETICPFEADVSFRLELPEDVSGNDELAPLSWTLPTPRPQNEEPIGLWRGWEVDLHSLDWLYE